MKYKKPKYNQYILKDKIIIKKIINSINPLNDDNFLEIGAGKGALTNEIIKYIDNLSIIEIDNNFLSYDIKNNKNINVIIDDIIKYDLYNIFKLKNKKIRIFGNLPYSITIPILLKFIKYKKYIKDINIMIQKELFERINSKINNKKYSKLTVLIKIFFIIKPIINEIDNNSFYPKPKIKSSFVKLIPIEKNLLEINNINFEKFNKIVFILFNNKRKILKNILKKYININNININKYLLLRIENLSIKDIIYIYNFFNI